MKKISTLLFMLICISSQSQTNQNSALNINIPLGFTYYDLQTFNSTYNHLYMSNDGFISACWTYSPDANTSTTPPYPNFGAGYNSYNPPVGWQIPYPGPTVPISQDRSFFPNIAVTPAGKEMTVQVHNITGSSHTKIDIYWRQYKGSGPWTTITPWNTSGFYNYPKACGAGTNENVYAIWIDDGGIGFGQLYFSISVDGGLNWTTETTIAEISPAFYDGFERDAYSIDARGDTVAISIGYEFTDMILLKSLDKGATWTKTIIQKHPIPHYNTCNCGTDYILNAVTDDTVRANAGDSKVLVDNDGMCHVWFSAFDYHGDSLNDSLHLNNDMLFYWNENMGQDTTTVWNEFTGGNGSYVGITSAIDYNSNGKIDVPLVSGLCTGPAWGYYGGGITEKPSAGIDPSGTIYLSYQSINELADTAFWQMAHKHIYMMQLVYPYTGAWSTPVDMIPNQAAGGDGENQECVFGSMSRNVPFGSTSACILYQLDDAPRTSISPIGSCANIHNSNGVNDIVVVIGQFPTSISDRESIVILNEIYPNPTKDHFTININLKNQNDIKITMMDITGRICSEINSGSYNTGQHSIKINTTDLKEGVYNCMIETANGTSNARVVVSR